MGVNIQQYNPDEDETQQIWLFHGYKSFIDVYMINMTCNVKSDSYNKYIEINQDFFFAWDQMIDR